MRGTRQAILEMLNQFGRASVSDLAGAVDVKDVTARHHLNALQADGLVQVYEERQPVGRPRHVYSLTEAGQSSFPQKYHLLTERLLEQLKASMPPETLDLLLRQLASQMVGDLSEDITQVPLEERLEHVTEVLSREGFMAQWSRDGDTLRLTEYRCPYYFVGQSHPEICTIDETIIEITLGADVMKASCLLDGDSVCTFEMAADAVTN